MTEREELLQDYKRNISYAEDELKYHFQEIARLKSLIKKNQLMINAINNYQLPISFSI